MGENNMCLSTAYSNEISDATAIMNNVMEVECEDNKVILTDLMGRTMEVDGTLLKASLTDGYVVLKTN
jgi:predicted RNA-binding protein